MLASRTARERTEKYPVAEVATGIIRWTDTKHNKENGAVKGKNGCCCEPVIAEIHPQANPFGNCRQIRMRL